MRRAPLLIADLALTHPRLCTVPRQSKSSALQERRVGQHAVMRLADSLWSAGEIRLALSRKQSRGFSDWWPRQARLPGGKTA